MTILQMILFLFFFILFANCSDSPQRNENSVDTSSSHFDNVRIVDSSIFYKGAVIFRKDCTTCHVAKGRDHNYLEGVVDRRGASFLKLYITKQDSLIAAKDSMALRIKEIWGNLGNSHNFVYSESDLNAIIEYLK